MPRGAPGPCRFAGLASGPLLKEFLCDHPCAMLQHWAWRGLFCTLPRNHEVSLGQGRPQSVRASDSFRWSFSLDLSCMVLGRIPQPYYNMGRWWGALAAPFSCSLPWVGLLMWRSLQAALPGATSLHSWASRLLSHCTATLNLCSQKWWVGL